MADKCGAKTRSGGRCRTSAMPNGRCRMHGGLSTGPSPGSQNALKHGMYAKYFTDGEMAASADTKLGDVELEIRICRLRLARALAAEKASKDKPELDEIIKRDISIRVGARKESRWRIRDYGKIIDTILGRIESLEKMRLLLRIDLPPSDADLNADALTPGSPDEAAPANPIR